jgi:hypothetical protein
VLRAAARHSEQQLPPARSLDAVARPKRRPELTTRLTPESRAAWDAALTRWGCSWTTLTEAMGEQLAAGNDSWIPREVIRRARLLDRERGSRRQTRSDEPNGGDGQPAGS